MNKVNIAVLLFAAAISAPAATEKKDPPAASPKPLTIPRDAVKNENGSYTYTDKQGKKWLYRSTPFGVIRSAVDESGTAAKPAETGAAIPTKAIDKGDTVQFERTSPFGKVTWEKKKSELTDDERRILEAQNKDQSAKPDAK